MKQVFSLLLVVSLTSFSCNQTKNVSEVSNEDYKESASDESDIIPNDSLVISFEQTGCFGTCPIHKMYIYQDGSATYTGVRHTKLTGEFSGNFSSKEIDAILSKADELSFYDSKREYTSAITDLPTTKIYIHNGNNKHQVTAYADYPESIQLMIAYLFEVSQNKDWQIVE